MLKPGMVINGYRIEEEVSRGAMAKSYRALKAGGTVFLKLYLSPKPSVEWFSAYVAYQEELRSRIESSSLRGFTYRIIEFFVATRPPRDSPDSKLYYQVFEWVDGGEDLASIIQKIRGRKSTFTWDQRLTWGKVIAGSIGQLHAQKIVHSDLKPENLIFFPDTSIRVGYRLKLIDMDFSLLSDKPAPWLGHQGYFGTAGWLSPEHLRGEVPSSASDVFTCALILYELLAAGNPYAGLDDAAFRREVLGHRAPRAHLAGHVPEPQKSALEEVLHRCLSPKEKDRPSISELSTTLIGRIGEGPAPPAARAEPVAAGGPPVSPAAPAAAAAKTRAAVPTPAALRLAGRDSSTVVSITTRFTSRLVRPLGDGSEYWDINEQFSLEKRSDGWFLVPNAKATNQTLVNRKAVTAAQKLLPGDEIAVGNEERGVVKLPLIVGTAV